MHREVKNVFTGMPDNNCFACHPNNPSGLRLKFYADDETREVYTRIKPDRHFAGFPGILHGGIQCALVDEVAFWTMFDSIGKLGLTTRVDIQYQKAVSSGVVLEVRGKISKIRDRLVVVDAWITDEEGTECTKSRVTYYLPTRDVLFEVIGRDRFTEDLMQYIKE